MDNSTDDIKSHRIYYDLEKILNDGVFNPNRPYSENELNYHREKLYRDLHMGPLTASHERCGHFYRVKNNGKKHKEIEQTKSCDVGNCSVCWKIHNTPRHLQEIAYGLVQTFQNLEDNDFDDQDKLNVEISFYTWLYRKFI